MSYGRSCTRELERLSASFGKISQASPQFENNSDLSCGGVLLSLPALISNGLLHKSENYFQLPSGYYGLNSVLIILGFLVLLRVKSLEGVRYLPPGELGKIVGLDRIPEVKTLREKVGKLSECGKVEEWQIDLSRYWMESCPELSGYLYIDGHVRVYYGNQTKLPRRYVSRERLCLRGLTDYWVNDTVGQPFFVVTTALTIGLIGMLNEEIIPRLLRDVPNQPSEEALQKDPYLHRFVIVFDREGYSPGFFEEMFFKHRIACITYKKYAQDEWAEEEFVEEEVVFKNGEKIKMKLSERKLTVGDLYWIREIRKLSEDGHQTSIVTTNYKSSRQDIAGAMFQRWSQENFFKYMMENFGIDRLIEYETQSIPDTARVVNPEYRKIDSEIRKHSSKLNRLLKEYGAKNLDGIDDPKKVMEYEAQNALLKEKITVEKNIKENLKKKRKGIAKHITYSQLPAEEQFLNLATDKKQFINTIKMIAYRAETALANVIRPEMARKDEARSFIKQIFNTEANLIVEPDQKRIVAELHNLTNEASDKLAQFLCNFLNDTDTVYPGTDLKIYYKMVSPKNPPGQEV